MKSRIFLSNKEKLKESLEFVSPQFQKLSSILPKNISVHELDNNLKDFCQDTFVLRDPNPPFLPSSCLQAQDLKQILNENVKQLLSINKKQYIQCLGHAYMNHQFTLKQFNFNRTILQNSLITQLIPLTGVNFIKELIYCYTVVVKYEGQYIQVTGLQISEQFNFKILGQKRKKNQGGQGCKYNYSQFTIDRFQMFYCTHMGRNSGIFRKSTTFLIKDIFFDKGIQKSGYYQQINMLIEKQIKFLLPERVLKPNQISKLSQIFYQFFNNMRNLLVIRHQNSRHNSHFDGLLSRFCRLPKNYQQIKKKVLEYITLQKGQPDTIFEEIYKGCSQYDNVGNLLKQIIKETVPKSMLGQQNFQILLKMMGKFVSMKRFQNYKIEDFLIKMDVFKLPWAQLSFNHKFKTQIISRGRMLLGGIIRFLFNKCIVPMIKYNFYVTEKHKEGNKIFYYRKPLWHLVAKLAIEQFSKDNLEKINENQYKEIKKNGMDYPEGKLRILPKKGTFRPIVTFNRKRKIDYYPYKATLNHILADTQLVLRNLKNELCDRMGYCIFDNRQIANKYDTFIRKWRQQGQPPLAYFTLDIKKCYDSIDTNRLMTIIKETKFIEDMYLIVRYYRLYRNKKPLTKNKALPFYFNIKERVNATSLNKDTMKIYEDSHPAINIFSTKIKIISREQIVQKLRQLCQGSIIGYQNSFWLQKVGIPQGLNVSGVLCSLYFATLQDKYVNVKQGLLMRLTDDYIYIGPETEAKTVLDSLIKCSHQNGFMFNSDKITANFQHELIKKISQQQQISWIGKKINIKSLQIFPFVQTSSSKLFYAMNVNLTRKHLKSFLKNKLKSLFTNHFASYFKPQLFAFKNLAKNVRIFTRISLQKYFPFLLQIGNLKIENECDYLLRILQICIHEFVVYAVFLSHQKDQNTFYNQLVREICDECFLFFKSKRHIKKLRKLEFIFKYRVNVLDKMLNQKQGMIQQMDIEK